MAHSSLQEYDLWSSPLEACGASFVNFVKFKDFRWCMPIELRILIGTWLLDSVPHEFSPCCVDVWRTFNNARQLPEGLIIVYTAEGRNILQITTLLDRRTDTELSILLPIEIHLTLCGASGDAQIYSRRFTPAKLPYCSIATS